MPSSLDPNGRLYATRLSRLKVARGRFINSACGSRLHRLRKNSAFYHSERSEESLFDCTYKSIKEGEILRFAQNDRINTFSAACSAASYGDRLLHFRGRGRPWPLAHNFQNHVFILRAVVMNLFANVPHITSWRDRHGAIGIELRSSAHPPRSGNYGDEPVIRMKMRMAHVMRVPLHQLHINARLFGIAGQNRRAFALSLIHISEP